MIYEDENIVALLFIIKELSIKELSIKELRTTGDDDRRQRTRTKMVRWGKVKWDGFWMMVKERVI